MKRDRMHVAYLMNIVPSYRLSTFNALARKIPNLTIFPSSSTSRTEMFCCVRVQHVKTFRISVAEYHPSGFKDSKSVEIPLNVFSLLMRSKPDVIISGEFGVRTLHALLYRLVHRRSRLVIHADLSEHTERSRRGVRRYFRKCALLFADVVVVNGASGAAYIRSLGYPVERIVSIPYATDTSVFGRPKRALVARETVALLYVGQLIERKGLRPFLLVLSEWLTIRTEIHVEFQIVGIGPIAEQFKNIDIPSNLTIRMCGPVDYHMLPSIYHSADIFVFPTLADTWGLVVNEAMACGVPVLGSVHSQAVQELVKDGLSGWTFDPEDRVNMYDAVSRAILTPRHSLEKMRIAATEAANTISEEVVADRYLKLLQKICPAEDNES